MRVLLGLLFSALLLFSASALSFREMANIGHFGPQTPPLQALPLTIKILNWNVHKGQDPAMWDDFRKMASDAHLVFFQEIVEDPVFIEKTMAVHPFLQWTVARAFVVKGASDYNGYSGVATGTVTQSVSEKVLISTVTEPIVNTPKTAVVTELPIEGTRQTLLTINIHSINFVFESTFRKQIQQVIEAIQDHQGPMLMTGDFNTWTDGRLIALKSALSKVGLKRVPIANYFLAPIFAPYDHIFVRGLRVNEARAMTKVRSSDHIPLLAEFEIITPYWEGN